MKRKIKKYMVSPDESRGLAFSIVDRPAVESEFTFLAEQKVENFVAAEGERRMIYGCALRPSFPIYRNNGKEEYYLEFDADAIDKISKNYFKMGFQEAWTEAHKDEVEGLTITESWIKESMTQDKSVALGLDPSLPIGTWFIGCYCENDDIWNAVKEGKYHGFSIEAVLGLEEFESQIDKNNTIMINENEEMFWSKLKNVIAELFSKETEKSEPIAEVNLEAEPQEPTVEPQEPTVTEPIAEPQEPQQEPQPSTEPQEPQNEPTEPQNEPQPIEEPKDNHLEDLIASLKDEITALKEMNNGLNDKLKELSRQPSTQPINTNAKPNAGDTYASWREQMAKYIG